MNPPKKVSSSSIKQNQFYSTSDTPNFPLKKTLRQSFQSPKNTSMTWSLPWSPAKQSSWTNFVNTSVPKFRTSTAVRKNGCINSKYPRRYWNYKQPATIWNSWKKPPQSFKVILTPFRSLKLSETLRIPRNKIVRRDLILSLHRQTTLPIQRITRHPEGVPQER